jgi:hypothetical protein
MGSEDTDEPDLALVSTYVPVVVALVRMTGAVVVAEAFAYAELHTSVRLVLWSVALYLDASRLRERDSRYERASGGLFLLALLDALRWQEAAPPCGMLNGMTGNVLDVMWAVCASTWCALACMGRHAGTPLYALVLAAGAFACGHVLTVCEHFFGGELLVRAYVYEIMCAVMIFGRRYVPNTERNLYLRSVPFACVHVLLVNVFVVVPSVLICVCLYAFLAYRTIAHSAPPAAPMQSPPVRVPCKAAKPVADDLLVMQLKLAKESQGV